MKKCFLGLILLFLSQIAYSQEDSVDFIYIGIEEEASPNPQMPQSQVLQAEKVSFPASFSEKGIFNKQVQVLRLLLAEESNLPLKYVSYPPNLYQDSVAKVNKTDIGLCDVLIEGIKTGKIVALNKDSLEYRYTYERLRNKVAQITHIAPEKIEESYFPFEEFEIKPHHTENSGEVLVENWTPLNQILDIVIEKGFNSTNSRPYSRILYFRLVWYNPEISPQAQVIAFIPYSFASPYLSKILLKPKNNTISQISVLDFFNAGLFRGHLISTQ